jgi:hypothetical protein
MLDCSTPRERSFGCLHRPDPSYVGHLHRHRRRDYPVGVPKIVQLHASITYYPLAVPAHLKLMSSDAGDRAKAGGLVPLFADPHDAVTKRQPTSRCGIHDLSPADSFDINAIRYHASFQRLEPSLTLLS